MNVTPNASLSEYVDRRERPRLTIRLPVECRMEANGGRFIVRSVTQNISSRGLYLELDSADFRPGDRLRVELTIPPAEGVSPYEGRASCAAQVLRVEPIPAARDDDVQRYGIAARFLDRLRISY